VSHGSSKTIESAYDEGIKVPRVVWFAKIQSGFEISSMGVAEATVTGARHQRACGFA
jgi:hypothetical protein